MEDLLGLLRAARAAMTGGAHADAAAHLARAIALRPGSAEILNEYGIALASAGDFAAASAALERAAVLAPGIAAIRNNLGNAYRGLGRLPDAAAQYRAALDLDPGYAEAEGNFGTVLQLAGLPDAAEDAYRRALIQKPDDALIRTHLGTALAAQGRLADAETEHRAALDRAPGLAEAHNNLAIVLKDCGRFAEARESYARALALRPGDAALHSNLLMCLCYDPAVPDAALLAAHRDWAAHHARPARRRFANPADPDRPLRIGLLSPDFRDHPVASFVAPVLAGQSGSWRTVCYADLVAPDEESERLEGMAFGWCDCTGLSDASLAARIREDGIDILFDLAGHTAHNRLPLFGRRAAPVQASWIGYPATTGLAEMDWRLTDARADPPGDADALHTERLLRLPDCFLCYTPPEEAPPLPPSA
ncbi:MAG: tetratricopeptide repeat protein, partial [Alphaproteobacteria bacterium]